MGGKPQSKERSKNNNAKSHQAPLHDAISTLSTEEKCNLIAELSESVLENPNTAFFAGGHDNDEPKSNTPKEPSKVKRLIDMADTTGTVVKHSMKTDEHTARLSIISLLAIFQDTLPSYRIRLPTEEEASVRVSKETKKMWQYERALLTHYQWYLKVLEQTWAQENTFPKNNKSQRPKTPSPLGITAILSLCELLKSAPHFNFHSKILSIVTRQANNRNCDQVATSCCNTITHLFKNDLHGEISLETTRMLTKMIYNRKFQVRSELLHTFLHLPLRVHEDEAEAAKIAQKAQTKKRKRNKLLAEQAKIEEEMRENDGVTDKILLAKNQADTLQTVILTYFRILKTDPKQNSDVVSLIPETLKGLAKFSHLIHFDTVLDLLKVLRGLLESVDALPLEAALNAVLAVFQILQGPGRELQIDQKDYVTPLYTQMIRMSSSDARSTLLPTLQCLTLAFLKRREYSTKRVASFFKQILTTSMHTETHISIPLVVFARQLLQQYSSTIEQLLENEADIITSGSYTPDVEDPEHSNPFATSAWELGLLKFHIDPLMGKHHADSCASNRLLQYPMEAPDRIFEERMKYNIEKGYIGCKIRRKKHPFHNSVMSKNNEKGKTKRGRQREQYRFVKARKTIGSHLLPYHEL